MSIQMEAVVIVNKSTLNKAVGNKSLNENMVNGAFYLMAESTFK